MIHNAFSNFIRSYRKSLGFCAMATFLLMIAVACTVTRLNFAGSVDGIYLLKGERGYLLELKNDLVIGEYQRLIGKIEFEALYTRWRSQANVNKGKPYLKYQWNKKTGGGYFTTFFPDGSKFLACFGRFEDEANKPVKGLFVGGGLPPSHYENSKLKTSETGVAYYNGKEWLHLWCLTKEAISPASDTENPIQPGRWEFLGSRVLFASQYKLIIKSSHLVRLDTVPVKIDRYLIYHAGDRFFTLINCLTNIGNSRVSYRYTYGDKSNRALQWNNRQTMPRQSEKMVLTIGMPDNDLKTGFQRSPPPTPLTEYP